MKKRMSGHDALMPAWNRSTLPPVAPPPGAPPPSPPRPSPEAAGGHGQVVIPRNPEQTVSMTRAPVKVVIVRRQTTVCIVIPDDGVQRQPAQKPVHVEARLEPLPPRCAISFRGVERRNGALNVRPVFVELVGLLREIVLVEDRPATTGAVRLVEIAFIRTEHQLEKRIVRALRSSCRGRGTRSRRRDRDRPV